MDREKNKKKILHIAAHIGGGVGRVLLNYLEKTKRNSNFDHKVISLGYAEEEAFKSSKINRFQLIDRLASDHKRIIAEIGESDIVLTHWWNHPLTYDFLVRNKLPASRVIMWSHISGFHPPQVFTEKALDYSDIFAFTTPLSSETKEIQDLSDKQKEKIRVVWSTGGVEHVRKVKPKKHSGFNIGYIGTVDYAKIHRNFIDICRKINIPDVKFIVCGGPNEKMLLEEAKALGIENRFHFTGHVSDITKYLEIFDVFGYPLAPHHYGTCDQVLAESMASGVVPVVLQNRMEKYMVKNGVTGIVAKNENDYIKAIQKLHRDKTLRETLSENAKKHAIETFSVDKMSNDWENIFEESLLIPKTEKSWDIKKEKITASDVFIESLGDHGKDFAKHYKSNSEEIRRRALKKIASLGKSDIWRSKTKGTVHNYHSYFPKDKHLSLWSKIILDNI